MKLLRVITVLYGDFLLTPIVHVHHVSTVVQYSLVHVHHVSTVVQYSLVHVQ